MLALFLLGVTFLEFTAELLVLVLLGAAAVAGAVAARHGRGWEDVQRSTGEKLAAVLPALLILLAIGALIASWTLSGTIPFLVYWGVRLVEPRYLVPAAFVATALMSLATGTSWGSAGTIGVALTGTAAALGAPLAATAGAVVSGAYLGDKMSPLSDSTNICAIAAGAPLFAHIRHMLWTAGPSFAMALVVYMVLGGGAPPGEGPPPETSTLMKDLEAVFDLGGWTLLPAAVVVTAIATRVPPAPAIALSSLVALGVGITVQPFSLQDGLTALVAGFRADMLPSAAVGAAGVGEAFLRLTERGGLHAMAPTLVVVIAAFLLAGAMDVSGALDLIIARMLAAVRGVFGLIGATMSAGATMIALTSHGGVTSLVIGGLFQPAYRDRGLAPENLSRSLEDSVTITEPLMPWTVSAVFMATTLGVPTSQYAPWAVFCWGGPCFSLLLAGLWRRTGLGIRLSAQAPSGAPEADGRPGPPAVPLAGTL